MTNEFHLEGSDLFGDPIKRKASGPVAEKFIFPPFSVLDARNGDWQNRKRSWLALGIASEVGRGHNLAFQGNAALFDGYRVKEGTRTSTAAQGTSVFDPVLCECVYRWFCPPGGQVVDPFAGGSVRGIVAGLLGLQYWGSDLRPEQVAANRAQGDQILPQVAAAPVDDVTPVQRVTWVCGDSAATLSAAPAADLIFSCPPYGDLEVYSDDPQDLSAMKYPAFRVAYRDIIAKACARLKPDRFACFVVGDFRDDRGAYRNFVGDTVEAFRAAGLDLYNEAILVTAVGTAALRVTQYFNASRKFAKTHQNVLIFCKGDPRKATAAILENVR